MAIFHPSRGGVRGGADQFDWEDVKTDKDRECYLGHTLKAPAGRWQKGKDLTWFNKEQSTAGLEKTPAEKRKAEIAAIKHQEEEMMAVALGRKPPPKPQATTEKLSKAEMKMLMKGETGDMNEKEEDSEAVKADRVKGLGFANQRRAMMGGVGGKLEKGTTAGVQTEPTVSDRSHSAAPGPGGQLVASGASKAKKSKKEKKEKKEKKAKKEKKQKKENDREERPDQRTVACRNGGGDGDLRGDGSRTSSRDQPRTDKSSLHHRDSQQSRQSPLRHHHRSDDRRRSPDDETSDRRTDNGDREHGGDGRQQHRRNSPGRCRSPHGRHNSDKRNNGSSPPRGRRQHSPDSRRRRRDSPDSRRRSPDARRRERRVSSPPPSRSAPSHDRGDRRRDSPPRSRDPGQRSNPGASGRRCPRHDSGSSG